MLLEEVVVVTVLIMAWLPTLEHDTCVDAWERVV